MGEFTATIMDGKLRLNICCVCTNAGAAPGLGGHDKGCQAKEGAMEFAMHMLTEGHINQMEPVIVPERRENV